MLVKFFFQNIVKPEAQEVDPADALSSECRSQSQKSQNSFYV